MVATEQIGRFFDSLQEFEQFRLRWIKACFILNGTSENMKRLKEMEDRAKRLGGLR